MRLAGFVKPAALQTTQEKKDAVLASLQAGKFAASQSYCAADSLRAQSGPLPIVIHGQTYDAREWLPFHPGGDIILHYVGYESREIEGLFLLCGEIREGSACVCLFSCERRGRERERARRRQRAILYGAGEVVEESGELSVGHAVAGADFADDGGDEGVVPGGEAGEQMVLNLKRRSQGAPERKRRRKRRKRGEDESEREPGDKARHEQLVDSHQRCERARERRDIQHKGQIG